MVRAKPLMIRSHVSDTENTFVWLPNWAPQPTPASGSHEATYGFSSIELDSVT